jgi:hypothetical protein
VVAAGGAAELSAGGAVANGAEGERRDPVVGIPDMEVLKQFGMGSATPLLATGARASGGGRLQKAQEGDEAPRRGLRGRQKPGRLRELAGLWGCLGLLVGAVG